MAEGTSVGSLYYDLNIDDKNLKGQLNSADSSVKSFSDKLHDGLNKAAAGFAVVGAGLTLISKNATDFTVETVKNAKNLGREIGVSTQEASRLVAAFGRMGVSADQAATTFGIFSKQIVKATQDAKDHGATVETTMIAIDKTKLAIAQTTAEIKKNGDKTGDLAIKLRELNDNLKTQQASLGAATNGFQKLGISTVDAQGKQKDFNTILFEVADKFKNMPNGIDKTALSMELFGRSGKDMIKVLNLGSAGIQELEKEADKLGLTLTSKNISAVSDYIKSQKDLKQSTDALKIAIGTTTAPVLTEFNKKFNDVILSLLKGKGPLHTATVDFLAFGGPVFGATGAVLAFAANAVQIAPALAKMSAALKDTAAAQWALNIAMEANPIVFLVTAIVALGLAIAWVATHMQETGMFMVNMSEKFRQLGPIIQTLIVVFMPFIGIPLLIVAYWGPISGFFSTVWGAVAGAFQWALVAILGVVFGVINAVSSIIGWFGRLPGSAANAVGGVVGWFAGLPGRILGALGNLAGLLFGAGQQMIQGMINGITNMFSTLAKKVKDAVGNAVSAVKGFLGIRSPSRVFMGIGRNVTEGFVKGINDSSNLAIKAMNNLGNNIIAPTMNVAQGAGGGPAGNTINHAGTVVNIGEIHNDQDEAYVLRRIDRNYQLEGMGLSPAATA